MNARRLFQLLLASALGTLASCEPSEKRLPTFPVTGSVAFADKKPAANATVVFHPTDPTITVRPRGKMAADGSFQLTSYDGNDGAPAGKARAPGPPRAASARSHTRRPLGRWCARGCAA